METKTRTAKHCVNGGRLVLVLHFLAVVGCGALAPARPICRDAGFGDAEVQALIPDIQAARAAGATHAEVVADSETACAACADADPPCVQAACVECFALLIAEVYDEPADDADGSQSGG